MPFQVGPLPKYLPDAPPFNVRGLCHRFLDLPSLVPPPRPNLKYLYALSTESIPKVQFVANMRWRSSFGDESGDQAFQSLRFEFANSHRYLAPNGAVQRRAAPTGTLVVRFNGVRDPENLATIVKSKEPNCIVVQNIPLLLLAQKIRCFDRFNCSRQRFRPIHLIRPEHDSFAESRFDETTQIGVDFFRGMTQSITPVST